MQRNLLRALLSLAFLFSFALGLGNAQAGSDVGFKVLHNFTGGPDGCCIYAGLARDREGNLYGVAYLNDDNSGAGDLFELTWTSRGHGFRILQKFSAADGLCMASPSFDGAGNLFGVCAGSLDDGTLWEYSNLGKFSILHAFNGPEDGEEPQGNIALDQFGNIFGTAYTYGPGGSGTLWEYSLSSGVFKVLHGFADGDDGGLLPAGPAIDHDGRVWGTTESGPNCYYCGAGTVWHYDLLSGTFATILDFSPSGIQNPQSSLTIDADGNLFGTAFGPNPNNCGLVYELQGIKSYAPAVVHPFTRGKGDGCLAFGNVALDARGKLIGTTYAGGSFGDGTVYELEPVNGGWRETILYSFNISDGLRPQSGLITDGKTNWFGTTSEGGNYGQGVVFELSGVR
jgi:uncharacterized repeat protein (TIGR03803 family)